MALKQQPGKNIGVHGSPTLVESLLHADLLDEMRLEIYPVIADTGKRLFSDVQPPKRLRLAESRITSHGVLLLTYARAGAVLSSPATNSAVVACFQHVGLGSQTGRRAGG